MFLKRLFAFLTVMALMAASGLAAQTSTQVDPWAGLRFLLGTWEAKTTGGIAQAQSSGAYSFQLELLDLVMARHSSGGACKGPADFDCQHGDLLYIYSAGSGETLQAIYFDNEGHVIQYGVSTPKPTMAVFLSDPTQPGAQFRLSYELAEGVMTGKFQMKMPGQTEFMSYLEWSGKPQ
jgi:hypothetical protein